MQFLNSTIGAALLPAATSVMLLMHATPVNADYDFHIVSPPGAENTQAFGINDDGIVTGSFSDGVSIFSFSYDMETGEYTTISDAADFSAFDINEKGVIVGAAEPLCAIRDKKGNVEVITPPVEGALSCQLRGVNAKGDATGFVIDDEGIWTGFVYDSNKDSYEPFLPSLQTIGSAINAAGQSVGSTVLFADEFSPGSAADRYGYMREKDGGVKFFKVLEPSGDTFATRGRGISENGLVTGFYFADVFPGFLAKSFVITLSPGSESEEITLTEDQILYQTPCDPNVPPPPGPSYELFTDVTAQQIRNDGVVVGSCLDFYVDLTALDVVLYSKGFVATPVE